MNLFDIILLAVALAMDCFTVSIVSGVMIRRVNLRMAFFFGLFQALMPLIGWLGISYFSQYLEAVDHWIAFAMLVFIGGKMLKDAFSPEEEQHFNPLKLSTQLLLAVATSIDALAVGISFACTGYDRLSLLTLPLVIIGVVSFLFSILGNDLGRRFGQAIAHRLKPELFGGIILILIGVKILVTHLWG
ncbi:MAG: manganese efflux pump [Prevotella sp.]|nr:manganese efflux pump [Prevotella sp.]